VIKQDTSENQAKLIYLAIGSNLGNRKNNIEKAKFILIENNIKILQISSYYETLSWPNPNNPKFLNIVLKVVSNLNPSNLIKLCKNIEKQLGRKKTLRNSPRECDIDIIDFGNSNVKSEVILPHPRMHTRNFVLFPLFELNKNWRHPILKQNIKKLINALPKKDIRSIKQI
jgi:2-amino-4-hydroxy-6-hydroxymethyldihydropteridine diphosphokinase